MAEKGLSIKSSGKEYSIGFSKYDNGLKIYLGHQEVLDVPTGSTIPDINLVSDIQFVFDKDKSLLKLQYKTTNIKSGSVSGWIDGSSLPVVTHESIMDEEYQDS